MQPPTLSILNANLFLINRRYPAQPESHIGRFYGPRCIVKIYRRHLLSRQKNLVPRVFVD
jgi:hypothetical protein